MEQKKVSEEQLEILRQLQADYDTYTKRYGELRYEMLKLDRIMAELEANRVAITQELMAEFSATGAVDLATGIFVPEE